MSKFELPHSLETASPEVIRKFIQDRKSYHSNQLKKSGVLSVPPQYLRNMAHTLGESPSAPLALDSDDAEEPKVDTYNMTARFVITTSSRDRHGDIVLPRGCVNHLKNYSRNPRIFFAHKTEDLPIASARDPEGNLSLEILEDKIYSTAYFHGETRESELIFRLIARKELQACSIGFLPIRATLIEDTDEDNLIDLDTGEEILDFRSNSSRQTPCLRFLEWDMIEWSVVPIPANQDALAAHLSRGHIEGEKLSPSIRRALSSFVSPRKNSFFPLTMVSKQQDDEDREVEELENQLENEIEAETSLEKDAESKGKPDPDKLDEVFKSYKEETNMSYSDLKKWSENKCSKRASLSSGPVNRNLELLSTPKEKWTDKHVTWANKTIAFNSRMRGMPRGKRLSEECPWSKRDISLKNWAWDPGKTPASKKNVSQEIEIKEMPFQGPNPGVDVPTENKKTGSLLGRVVSTKYKATEHEVRMAMAVLLHLQDGLLPEKIKFGVYTMLAKHYKLLDIPSPDYRKFSSLEEIKTTFPEIDIKEFTIVATNEENWIKSAMEELVSPPAQGKPGKKKKKEDEDEEVKAASPDEEEEKETDTDEEAAKKSEDEEEKSEDEEEDKAVEEEDKDAEIDTKDILKSMSEVMQSMHECSNAHTELLKGLHEKMDECMKSFGAKNEQDKANKEEDEMKSILNGLMTLKSNQDALNRRLFEVTGKR